MAGPDPCDPISNYEARIAGLRISHGPGCLAIGQSAIAGLSGAEQVLLVNEALRCQLPAKIRGEIASGTRRACEFFLDNLAEALLRLPDTQRAKRLPKLPKMLRVQVLQLIATFQADALALLVKARTSEDVLLRQISSTG